MAKYRNVQMALFRRWDATLAQFSISLLYYKRILFSCCIISLKLHHKESLLKNEPSGYS